MSNPETYRVDESGALAECEPSDAGARNINWQASTNESIATTFGISNKEVARARPAKFCTDVEDFAGRVGLAGRSLPAEEADTKSKKAKTAKPVTTKTQE